MKCKFAKMQAKVNALKHGDTAAMSIVETLLLLIGVIVVAAVLFMFLVTKIKGSENDVESQLNPSSDYDFVDVPIIVPVC